MAELYQTKQQNIPVEANRVTADNAAAIAAWCDGVLVTEHDALQHDVTFAAINVPTPNGMKRAQEGDWVVCLNGSFLGIKAEDFSTLFEAVVDG